MKKINIPGILFVMIAILMISTASAGGEEVKQVFPENDTAGFVPVDIIVIDTVIKASSPHFDFLVLDAEGKKNYLDDLSADIDFLYPTDTKKEEKIAGLVARLNAIWDKYPVVSETRPGSTGYPTYGGSEITIRFAPSVTSTWLTDDENAAIRESAAIMNEVYVKSHPTQPAPLPSSLVILAMGCNLFIAAIRKNRL